MGPSNAAVRLLDSVLNRYGTLEEFLVAVHADPRADTLVLPVPDPESCPRTARHRRTPWVTDLPIGRTTAEPPHVLAAGWGDEGRCAPIFVTGRHTAVVTELG